MKKLLLVVSVLCLVSGVSFAKTAKGGGKTGLGFSSQLSNAGVTSLALRYWGPGKTGFEGLFGFSMGDNNKYLDLGAKIMGAIKKEQNLTLYGFGLLGMENYTIKIAGLPDQSETTTMISGGFGVEFFFQGLPNLGFGAELGLGYNSTSKAFGLNSAWLSNLGLRYYF